jgi:tRNA A37 threonylcarbamoyladenosine synthetase subunit TsaC/SUA5/YrdC
VSSRSASQAAQRDLDQELATAERRGAARVRAQVRDLLDDRRRIVRVGEHQIEVVEVAALADLLVDEPD